MSALSLLAVVGCGRAEDANAGGNRGAGQPGPGRVTDTGTSGADGASEEQPTGCMKEIDARQNEDSSCCLLWEQRACDRGLFCAALGGAQEATCRPDFSQPDQAACGADVHCASGSCLLDAGVCQSAPGQPCTGDVGCADGPDGNRYVCLATQNDAVGERLCEPVGSGGLHSVCEIDGDCREGVCSQNTCSAGLGDGCGSDEDCMEGRCYYCDHNNVFCETPERHYKECLQRCGDSVFSVCSGGGE